MKNKQTDAEFQWVWVSSYAATANNLKYNFVDFVYLLLQYDRQDGSHIGRYEANVKIVNYLKC